MLGMAVGDALGLPLEGLAPDKVHRLLSRNGLGHRFLPGRGMVSDDTEHLLMTAQALLESRGDPALFARSLARRLKWWLAGLPAGIGLGTLRALVRLWLGFSPNRSGVFTAGNGPAMRSPIIGALFGDNPQRMEELVLASTTITHTDPKATCGATVIARCACMAVGLDAGGADREAILATVISGLDDPQLTSLLESIPPHLQDGSSVETFARDLGIVSRRYRGVSGYMYHTVPVVVYAWLRHLGDFEATLSDVIAAGGDTDTTGGIAGSLAGAVVGETGIPQRWLDGICEWPRSTAWMRSLADRTVMAARGEEVGPLPLFWPGLIPRNLFFMAVVLGHGFRRMVPF